MDQAIVVSILLSVVSAATPLLLAATGELVTEKSGVLNLGVEGMMLVGAVAGFAVTFSTGSALLGIVAAALGGAAMALIFAFLTLTLLANQVATGLALTIFGIGLAAMMGADFVGHPVPKLPSLDLPGLTDLPFLGPILFGQDGLVYLSFAILIGTIWFLFHTHAGLTLRAVGDSHEAAHAIGYPVIRIRYLATLFGGAMSGLAGAYLSLSYTPMWAEDMTSGRGWIALALVVFATWRPLRVLLGAYLFGGITILQFHIQTMSIYRLHEWMNETLPDFLVQIFMLPFWGLGWVAARIPILASTQFISMLPYLTTIVVLCVISTDRAKIRLNAPACLGRSFHAAG